MTLMAMTAKLLLLSRQESESSEVGCVQARIVERAAIESTKLARATAQSQRDAELARRQQLETEVRQSMPFHGMHTLNVGRYPAALPIVQLTIDMRDVDGIVCSHHFHSISTGDMSTLDTPMLRVGVIVRAGLGGEARGDGEGTGGAQRRGEAAGPAHG